jgi:tetratricopeptide (TPR) repeat protein
LGPLDRDAESFFDPAVAYDKRLFGEYRYGLMGSAWLQLNAFAEAVECFDRAGALADDPIEYRAKATLARTRLSRAQADVTERSPTWMSVNRGHD